MARRSVAFMLYVSAGDAEQASRYKDALIGAWDAQSRPSAQGGYREYVWYVVLSEPHTTEQLAGKAAQVARQGVSYRVALI